MHLGDIKRDCNRSQWSIIAKHFVLNPKSNGKPLENVKRLNKLLTFCFKNITWLLCGGRIGERERHKSLGDQLAQCFSNSSVVKDVFCFSF